MNNGGKFKPTLQRNILKQFALLYPWQRFYFPPLFRMLGKKQKRKKAVQSVIFPSAAEDTLMNN